MNRLEKGYVHIYTGNGKGKTTAALGQALRAAGSGLTTFIVMFMKDFSYGEIRSLKHLSIRIRLEQYGNDAFVICKNKPDYKDIAAAQHALRQAREAMLSARFDVVIMDEVCVAIHFGLLKSKELLSFLAEKPDSVELILTGRYCPSELIEKADLVTEMREIKHYYQKGVAARKGIES
jgi:cob(I)alamin adenosyltransferase